MKEILRFFQRNLGYTKRQAYISACFISLTFVIAVGTFSYKIHVNKIKTYHLTTEVKGKALQEITSQPRQRNDIDKGNNFSDNQVRKNLHKDRLRPEKDLPKGESIVEKKRRLPEVSIEKIDLNDATEADLKKLKGIGDKLAGRIVKFREKLGGFVDINQIDDVYGIDRKVLDEIKKKVKVSQDFHVKKLKINILPFKEILAHPYIGYESTKRICNYKAKCKITDIEQLKEILIEDDRKSLKYLKSYLEF